MKRLVLVLLVVVACGKKEEPTPSTGSRAPVVEREENAELYALERQTAEIDALITDLNRRLEAALEDLKSATSEADRERVKAVVDKLAGEKATLDKRVEALDAAVKAHAAKRD